MCSFTCSRFIRNNLCSVRIYCVFFLVQSFYVAIQKWRKICSLAIRLHITNETYNKLESKDLFICSFFYFVSVVLAEMVI